MENRTEQIPCIQITALHGFTGHGADFDLIRQSLERRQRTLALPKLTWSYPTPLGHRSLPDNDCSVQAQRAHFSQELSSFKNKPKYRVLLAYSMGARLALLHASEEPVFWDALILISCNPGIQDEAERSERLEADATLAEAIAKNGLDWFLSYWQSLPLIETQLRAPKNFRLEMVRRKRGLSAHGLAQCLREFGPASCPNLWSAAKKINCPLLCIHGVEDTKYARIHQSLYDSLNGTTPLIQSVPIPKSGHAPHIENPKDTANAIENFLRTVFKANTQTEDQKSPTTNL
ncbi:MAG: hypothetical protein CML12_02565 [Puniceicoccaceae bacterium]|nr:hypothetical protein [Puniceicoccaceae bacterium]